MEAVSESFRGRTKIWSERRVGSEVLRVIEVVIKASLGDQRKFPNFRS